MWLKQSQLKYFHQGMGKNSVWERDNGIWLGVHQTSYLHSLRSMAMKIFCKDWTQGFQLLS